MTEVYDVFRFANLGWIVLTVGLLIALIRDKSLDWAGFRVKVLLGALIFQGLVNVQATIELLMKGAPSGPRNVSQFIANGLVFLALLGVLPHLIQRIIRKRKEKRDGSR